MKGRLSTREETSLCWNDRKAELLFDKDNAKLYRPLRLNYTAVCSNNVFIHTLNYPGNAAQ